MTDEYVSDMVALVLNIKVFNKTEGKIIIGYPSKKYSEKDFLNEGQTLLNNVASAVGN